MKSSLFLFGTNLAENVLLCYFDNQAQLRPTVAKFYPEDIDASLCTHVIFNSARLRLGLDGDYGLGPLMWNDLDEDWMTGMYTRLNALKQVNPHLKTILSVGNSDQWTLMVKSGASIRGFIKNAIQYVRNNGFDGIELDWRYPARCNRVQCSPEVKLFVTVIT